MFKRYTYWWLALIVNYIFPLIYFIVKLGITKESTSIIMPIIIISIGAIIHLCRAIPIWVESWRPCVLKGIIKASPIYLLFICLITFGLIFKYILENQIDIAFTSYFETVLVVFGSMCIGSVFSALHQKYRDEDLLRKGYVLGVVNKYGK